MSKMIQCDECKKLMFTDSREDRGAFVSMTADDPIYGFSSFHLCRKCYVAKFPWLVEVLEERADKRTGEGVGPYGEEDKR